MKKEKTLEKINRWINTGKIIVRGGKHYYYEIYREVSNGRYLITRINGLYATDKAVARELNILADNGIIMSYKDVMIKMPYLDKRHKINAACALGKLLKARVNGTVFFIRDYE